MFDTRRSAAGCAAWICAKIARGFISGATWGIEWGQKLWMVAKSENQLMDVLEGLSMFIIRQLVQDLFPQSMLDMIANIVVI